MRVRELKRVARYGSDAVEVGTPDVGQNGEGAEGVQVDGADTIANVLHFIAAEGGDPDAAMETAARNFRAERRGEA